MARVFGEVLKGHIESFVALGERLATVGQFMELTKCDACCSNVVNIPRPVAETIILLVQMFHFDVDHLMALGQVGQSE